MIYTSLQKEIREDIKYVLILIIVKAIFFWRHIASSVHRESIHNIHHTIV